MKLTALNPSKLTELPQGLLVTRKDGVLHSVHLNLKSEESVDSLTTGWTERVTTVVNMDTGTADHIPLGTLKVFQITATDADEPGAKVVRVKRVKPLGEADLWD